MIMVTRPASRSLTTAAGLLGCLALSACGTVRACETATPSAAAPSIQPVISQLTNADLQDRLLLVTDLPSGYRPYRASTDFPDRSDKPACITTLDSLTSPSPPAATVTEANVAFAASQTGPWVEEVLRSYPGQGASQAFTSTKVTLAGCHTFSLAWSAPAEAATESVTPAPSPSLGDQSWSASITVHGSVPVTERLVLVQAGSSLLALQVASAIGLPSDAQINAIAARAMTRLAHNPTRPPKGCHGS
jgi:hypothetical protein